MGSRHVVVLSRCLAWAGRDAAAGAGPGDGADRGAAAGSADPAGGGAAAGRLRTGDRHLLPGQTADAAERAAQGDPHQVRLTLHRAVRARIFQMKLATRSNGFNVSSCF